MIESSKERHLTLEGRSLVQASVIAAFTNPGLMMWLPHRGLRFLNRSMRSEHTLKIGLLEEWYGAVMRHPSRQIGTKRGRKQIGSRIASRY